MLLATHLQQESEWGERGKKGGEELSFLLFIQTLKERRRKGPSCLMEGRIGFVDGREAGGGGDTISRSRKDRKLHQKENSLRVLKGRDLAREGGGGGEILVPSKKKKKKTRSL